MSTTAIVIIVVVAIVLIGLAALVLYVLTGRRRTEDLRETFGDEYDRAVGETGSRRSAESELSSRRKRVDALDIHELSADERTRFADAWETAQADFVDDPKRAIAKSDRLVSDVMQRRGYPVGDFEQRAADVSVDHADVVEHYRAAHEIAQAQSRGQASTEDLRQAMIHYRALFNDLLGEVGGPEPQRRAG
jgi:hypothetical protein